MRSNQRKLGRYAVAGIPFVILGCVLLIRFLPKRDAVEKDRRRASPLPLLQETAASRESRTTITEIAAAGNDGRIETPEIPRSNLRETLRTDTDSRERVKAAHELTNEVRDSPQEDAQLHSLLVTTALSDPDDSLRSAILSRWLREKRDDLFSLAFQRVSGDPSPKVRQDLVGALSSVGIMFIPGRFPTKEEKDSQDLELRRIPAILQALQVQQGHEVDPDVREEIQVTLITLGRRLKEWK